MDTRIKLSLEFTISESALEDAMAEYDELTVEGLISELLDKAIAVDEITTKVVDGPNTQLAFASVWTVWWMCHAKSSSVRVIRMVGAIICPSTTSQLPIKHNVPCRLYSYSIRAGWPGRIGIVLAIRSSA